MLAVPVSLSAPVLVPTRLKQHGFAAHIKSVHHLLADCAIGTTQNNTIDVRERLQLEVGQVFAARVAMKGAIEIRSRVRDHVDLCDVEFSSCVVVVARRFTR